MQTVFIVMAHDDEGFRHVVAVFATYEEAATFCAAGHDAEIVEWKLDQVDPENMEHVLTFDSSGQWKRTQSIMYVGEKNTTPPTGRIDYSSNTLLIKVHHGTREEAREIATAKCRTFMQWLLYTRPLARAHADECLPNELTVEDATDELIMGGVYEATKSIALDAALVLSGLRPPDPDNEQSEYTVRVNRIVRHLARQLLQLNREATA